ncbi:MAG: sulfatase-like hydrolase/transferase, partial [Myxococcales bacterium]|nr:sulfatase-like hydrolase/transferase [Myxococcales bacterium]
MSEPTRADGEAPIVQAALAGLCAFALVGVIDFALMSWREPVWSAGALSALLALVQALGMVSVLGLVVGAAAWVVLTPSFAVTRPARWLAPRRAAPSADAEGSLEALRHEATGWVLGAAIAAAAPLLAVWRFAPRTHAFSNPALVAPFLVLVVGASLLCALAVLFIAQRAVARVAARLLPSGRVGPLPLPLVVLAALVALGAVVAWALASRANLAVYRLGPYALLGVGVVLTAVGVVVRRPRFGPRTSGVLVVAALAALLFAAFGWSASSVSVRIVPLGGGVSRVLVSALRHRLDFDGDGYSALFGGGDCDDFDAKIGPGAYDIPGDGIDQNCDGHDATAGDPADDGRIVRAPLVPPHRYNVVLIFVDTLRPDHLGAYGYDRPTSPNIDRFMASATRFAKAWSQAPNTPRSLPAVFTGRYPSRIAWEKRFANFADVTPSDQLLFQIFHAAGWRTAVVSENFYFDLVPNLHAGVEDWDNAGAAKLRESMDASPAPDITRRTLARLHDLAATGEPFAMMVHYFAPHARYVPHTETASFGTRPIDLYDGEIAFVDHYLAPVFAALDAPALRDDTIVVFFADHGEAFGEHGLNVHGRTVFEEEVRVPLAIRVPGVAPSVVERHAALIDILPTLAEWTGLSAPRAQGRSLVPLMIGRGPWPPRLIFMESLPYPMHPFWMDGAVDRAGYKLIRDQTQNITLAFDLNRDPHEQHDLIGQGPVPEALAEGLRGFIDATPSFAPEASAPAPAAAPA